MIVKSRTIVKLEVLDQDTATYYVGVQATRTRVLTIDRATYEEMGSPVALTITIEPGDKLNDEGESV